MFPAADCPFRRHAVAPYKLRLVARPTTGIDRPAVILRPAPKWWVTPGVLSGPLRARIQRRARHRPQGNTFGGWWKPNQQP